MKTDIMALIQKSLDDMEYTPEEISNICNVLNKTSRIYVTLGDIYCNRKYIFYIIVNNKPVFVFTDGNINSSDVEKGRCVLEIYERISRINSLDWFRKTTFL